MFTLLSDNLITYTLTDSNGDTVAGATVTGIIEDVAGTEITTFNFTDVGAGVYTAIVADDALTDLEAEKRYIIVITATSGGHVLVTHHSELARYQTG